MLNLIEKNDHLFIEINGPIQVSTLLPFIEKIISTEHYLTMNNIWFFNKTTINISLSEFWDVVHFINKTHPGHIINTRVAIVTCTYFEKALAKIWVSYAKTLPFETASFDNLIDAKTWIDDAKIQLLKAV